MSSGISVLLAVCSWFVVLLYFIFILMDYNRFMSGMKNLIPEKYKATVLHVAKDIKDSMNRYCVYCRSAIQHRLFDNRLADGGGYGHVYRASEYGALFAVGVVGAHGVVVCGLCCRDRRRLLGHLHHGSGGLCGGAIDTRLCACAQDYGQDDGSKPGDNPVVVEHLGYPFGLPRSNHSVADDHPSALLLQSLRAGQ